MSTATGGRPPGRLGMFMGHHVAVIFLGYAAWNLAVNAGLPLGPYWVSYPLAVIPAVILVLAIFDGMFVHDRGGLCERCIREAPALNPQPSVDRWKPLLRFHHSRWAVLVAGAAVAGIFASVALRGWRAAALDSVAVAALAWMALAEWQHRRLQPWCPYCHWGDGGDPEQVPDPDPAASLPA